MQTHYFTAKEESKKNNYNKIRFVEKQYHDSDTKGATFISSTSTKLNKLMISILFSLMEPKLKMK